MSDRESGLGDPIIDVLSRSSGALGQYVQSYPGSYNDADHGWLNDWFLKRISTHFRDSISDEDHIDPILEVDPMAIGTSTALPATLVTLQPHYFRGFRQVDSPIILEGQLVVVEGRNSSGKTSLGEAFEWLLTGALSRREARDHGSPQELENCVANQFRPENESTWVAAEFNVTTESDTEAVKLRRVLVRDYGSTGPAKCESKLFVNDTELSREEEFAVLDRLFGSVEPILMQHTLRHFVESSPDNRRQYFERLLRLNELTELVAISVITDGRLDEFSSPNGRTSLHAWTSLGGMVAGRSIANSVRRSTTRTTEDIDRSVRQALIETARSTFTDLVDSGDTFEVIRSRLDAKQRQDRQRSFPPLESLRPRVQLTDATPPPDYRERTTQVTSELATAWNAHDAALAATAEGTTNRSAIVSALKHLLDANIIDSHAKNQPCPLCNYSEANSLTDDRIREIQSWQPLFERERAAQMALEGAALEFALTLRKPIEDYESLIPDIPRPDTLASHLSRSPQDLLDAVEAISGAHRTTSSTFARDINLLSRVADNPLRSIESKDQLQCMTKRCLKAITRLNDVHSHAKAYAHAFRDLEQAVGRAARQDPQYRVGEAWLACADNVATIIADLRWEDAKLRAQRDLQSIRNILLDFRRDFLESRRSAFNDRIQTVWSNLREDIYSRFSDLSIPETRRRRLPVEIEVKALLDDGNEIRRVDALQVFSESQVNALGIAAFITRSQMIGHRLLIFDDPVQSMDEEHFKTFARDVLGLLLDEGFQIVILTHNDTFARDVGLWHYDRDEYVSMSVRHSRREGCIVEDGNRRVHERLKHAEKLADDGKPDEAWRRIRLAVERLYLISYDKYGPDAFNPVSWTDHTADYMWDSGAGEVIVARVPDAEGRLKEILKLTVAGAHDAPARGETDIRVSIAYLKSMLGRLRIGG